MVRIGIMSFARWITLLPVALLLQACYSAAYLPGQQTVGRLRTIGPNVLVNEQPAHDGQAITVGDRLHTGADSSAYVYFLSGGFVQLDENTDPFFKIAWDGKGCRILILGLRIGQAYHEAGHQCRTEVSTPHAEWAQPARQFDIFNLKVDPQKSVLTLLDGKIALSKPKFIQLQPKEQVTVTTDGVVDVRTPSDQDLKAVTRWRLRFPAPCSSDGTNCAPPSGPPVCGRCSD